jgi:hypothetical protein
VVFSQEISLILVTGLSLTELVAVRSCREKNLPGISCLFACGDLPPEEREKYLGRQETFSEILLGWLVEHALLSPLASAMAKDI